MTAALPPYRVLQVLPALDAGGVERTTLEIAEALIAAGHEAHVASEGGRLVPELLALGGRHYTVPGLGSKNPLTVPRRLAILRRLSQKLSIDLIHARSRAPAWPARAAAHALGVPFVTTYHGIYNEGFPGKRRYNSVMAKGQAVIANSNFTRDHILKTHKIDPARITVIPRGVDVARFDPAKVDPKAASALRRSWGVPEDAVLVLLPGRLTRWKGQLVALDAMPHLPGDHHLVLVGDAQGRDDYVAEIRACADLWGCSDRVHIPGHSSDMPTVLSAADVVICPSTDPEAFGRTAAEAQAMGRWVIASAHGGALETVVTGGEAPTGALVPPGDSEALAAAIQARPIPYDGGAARARIDAAFSKAALQAATLAVYDRCLR